MSGPPGPGVLIDRDLVIPLAGALAFEHTWTNADS